VMMITGTAVASTVSVKSVDLPKKLSRRGNQSCKFMKGRLLRNDCLFSS
jgi:hypothetical protein